MKDDGSEIGAADRGRLTGRDAVAAVFVAALGDERTNALDAFGPFLEHVEAAHDAIGGFRESTQFPSRGVAAPEFFGDTGRSDHVYFWRNGYPALMITDTANFRYVDYHHPTDTPDKIDFDRYSRVTLGLARMLESLAFSSAPGNENIKSPDSSQPAFSSASQPARARERAGHPSSNPSVD